MALSMLSTIGASMTVLPLRKLRTYACSGGQSKRSISTVRIGSPYPRTVVFRKWPNSRYSSSPVGVARSWATSSSYEPGIGMTASAFARRRMSMPMSRLAVLRALRLGPTMSVYRLGTNERPARYGARAVFATAAENTVSPTPRWKRSGASEHCVAYSTYDRRNVDFSGRALATRADSKARPLYAISGS